MKNTQYVRLAQYKKGIAPIIIALIVAVVLGGGYVVVKTNPGIAKKLGVEKQVEKKEAIAGKKEEKGESRFCHNFSEDIKEGAQNGDVFALNQVLVKEKLMTEPEEPHSLKTFYKETTHAVTKFQAKYNIKQTGVIESDTRLQLNKLYGCGIVEAKDWKTYQNTKFGFEIKYPANYFIEDYGYTLKNTTFTAAIIAISDSKKTYESGGAKIVVYASGLPTGFKNSEEYLKYMRTSYPSMKNITVTKEDTVDLGGTEGIQFFGGQKDSAGKVENVQSIVGYSNKTGYEVVAYSSDSPLFSEILSTFKFTK